MNIPFKPTLRRLKYFAMDHWEILTGRRDPLTPPVRLQSLIGGGDFAGIGQAMVNYSVSTGGLQSWHHVLDVGCGCGRVAVPLTRVLDGRGSYDGLDIDREAVKWCNRSIHRRFKSFRFHHADLANSAYNPAGKARSRDYKFPFADNSYDFIFLTSVFTHMLKPDVEHYLAELYRVMRPGARVMVSMFLLNDESLALIAGGHSTQAFMPYERDTYVTDPKIPESAVGYTESWVRQRVAAHGLSIAEPIHFGNWCDAGRKTSSYQDGLIFTKS